MDEILREVIAEEIASKAGQSLIAAFDALKRSDYTEAEQALNEALRQYRRIGALIGEAQSFYYLADIALKRSDQDAARRAYEEAAVLYRSYRSTAEEVPPRVLSFQASCLSRLGSLAFQQRDYITARRSFEEAAFVYWENGSTRITSIDCIVRLGEAAFQQADYETASRAFSEALQLYRDLPRQGHQRKIEVDEANCAYRLGEVAFQQLDYDEARRYFGDALSFSKKLRNSKATAKCKKKLLRLQEPVKPPKPIIPQTALIIPLRRHDPEQLYRIDELNELRYVNLPPASEAVDSEQLQMLDDNNIRREAETSADHLLIPAEAREDFIQRFTIAAIVALSPPLPTAAPELYKPRGPESIVSFLRRVWGPWVRPKTPAIILALGDQLFSRAKLAELDPRAGNAVVNWLRTNRLPDDIFLPTPEQINDALTADTDAVRLARRMVSAAGCRQPTPPIAKKARRAPLRTASR